MQCEMCGRETAVVRASIEGTEMNVCNECAQFGARLSAPVRPMPAPVSRPPRPQPRSRAVETVVEMVAEDCAEKVKSARERLGLKQEDFAKRIQEKESVVHNIESGRFKPPLELARKLERFLKIQLVEKYEEKGEPTSKTSREGMTIGDLLEFK
jgi:putative transcription factor